MTGGATHVVIVADDKLGGRLAAQLGSRDGLQVYVDHSTTWKRVARVVFRRQLPLSALWRMFVAERRRPGTRPSGLQPIRSNADLVNLVSNGVRHVFLFRAGLIVGRRVLATGVDIFNVHCASLPRYAGLGSIARALADGSYQQAATVHRITAAIDAGPVVDVEPYSLDPARSYGENEDRAYDAGIRLLLRTLDRAW